MHSGVIHGQGAISHFKFCSNVLLFVHKAEVSYAMAKYAIQVDICVALVSNCVALRYKIQANLYPVHGWFEVWPLCKSHFVFLAQKSKFWQCPQIGLQYGTKNKTAIRPLHGPPFAGRTSFSSRKALNWRPNMLHSACPIFKVTGFEKKRSNH